MQIKPITPDFAVSAQLWPDDLSAAREQGFRSVIVNRPDGEEAGQPGIATMREAASAAGLGFAAVPVRPGQVTEESVDQFAAAMRDLEGPVLGYCRTGSRAATLWALTAAETLEPEAVLNATAAAGYDLASLHAKLAQRHAGRPEAEPSAPSADRSDRSSARLAGEHPGDTR